MSNVPSEVLAAYLSFLAFWIALVLTILVGARWSRRLNNWRRQLLAQWKPALGIAFVTWVSIALSGRGLFNPTVILVFCQALVGLALARSLAGFEPLPVVRSIFCRERTCILKIAVMLITAMLVIIPVLLVGSIGLSLGRQIFHEINYTREAQNSMQYDIAQLFFALLWGAGIAEETVYRLVAVSLVWRLTGHAGLGIVAGAFLFAAYHFTPLDGMYLTFWKFPISQFISTMLVGAVWGYLYVKRGYETVVLGHSFQNWLPMALFTLVAT